MANALLYAIAALIAVGRFLIMPRLDVPTAEGCYEAFAHLFVGFLFGGWAVSKGTRWNWLALAAAISLLELAVFIEQKGRL